MKTQKIVKSQAEYDAIPASYDGRIEIRLALRPIQVQRGYVNVYDTSEVIADGNQVVVVAHDYAKVDAHGSVVVMADGNSRINAFGQAFVCAHDHALVNALDSSTVVSHDEITVHNVHGTARVI